MKTSYEARAIKFAHILANLLDGCDTLNDVEYAIDFYNETHSNKLKMDHGVSRIAILRADYVIKFDYINDDKYWQEHSAGTNETERRVYEKACHDGYDYLLAKTTLVKIDDRVFSIMPRIDGIGDCDRYYADYLSSEEYNWLNDNVCDLHEYNLGYKNGKPVVIDYAFEATN